MYKKSLFGKFDDATRLNVLAVSKEADLKGGSSMTRGKSLSLVNDQDSWLDWALAASCSSALS